MPQIYQHSREQKVFQYIFKVRANDLYATEVYSINSVHTTGKLSDMSIEFNFWDKELSDRST